MAWPKGKPVIGDPGTRVHRQGSKVHGTTIHGAALTHPSPNKDGVLTVRVKWDHLAYADAFGDSWEEAEGLILDTEYETAVYWIDDWKKRQIEAAIIEADRMIAALPKPDKEES